MSIGEIKKEYCQYCAVVHVSEIVLLLTQNLKSKDLKVPHDARDNLLSCNSLIPSCLTSLELILISQAGPSLRLDLMTPNTFLPQGLACVLSLPGTSFT